MEHKRTLTMNWDGLGEEDDDDRFFESANRFSSAVPLDLTSSGSDHDDGEFEDSRLSFTSCISSKSFVPVINNNFRNVEAAAVVATAYPPMLEDYGMWMAEPGDIKERRKRLLQGMGLASNKSLISKIASAKIVRAVSGRVKNVQVQVPTKPEPCPPEKDEQKQETTPDSTQGFLVRSRSDGDIETISLNTKKRKEELIGPVSKQRLIRTSSLLIADHAGLRPCVIPVKASPQKTEKRSQNSGPLSSLLPDGGVGSFFLIKNLDTGKEFIVKEHNEQGMWNKLSDVQTGKQLTMEEFEKSVGNSPVVKELMRRAKVSKNLNDNGRKMSANSYLSKSFRYSKRRGVSLLKNIKGVANTMSGRFSEREREHPSVTEQIAAAKNSSQWIKVRQQGKSYKEFSALHLCQEIQAHEGSIWTIKFSTDAHYLASAGEDRVIHIWEVQECEVMSTKSNDDLSSVSSTPLHPMVAGATERPSLAEIAPMPSEKRKKGKHNKKKSDSMPDYARVPETVFSLSEKPICSFTGHQDDVLDLSWSRCQQLLSSSMDKTVRLWDIETKSCLKLFAHNDYVTCIHFNPVDDNFFISGSLDAKVRVWNVPDRYVVDWTDFHEMVTAACYTPDGQGAVIGSHKGGCRSYTIVDEKLEQKDYFEFQTKKKSQAKKITGLQFSPSIPTELLVTSADSRVRIVEGTEVVHKFKGFRNTGSQISASISPDGKYIISASEDNNVYIWKREDHSGKSRSRVKTQSHEQFPCREVSVAIPWPVSLKNEPPVVEMHSRTNSKRSSQPPQSGAGSPPQEGNSGTTDSKRHLPPLPKKNNNRVLERIPSDTAADEEPGNCSSRIDPGIGVTESFRSNDSPSISASSNYHSQSLSSSRSFSDGGTSNGGHSAQATAWGAVIVAATLGGEIRVYQNFGLPVKVGRLA